MMDKVSQFGERSITTENLEQLKGFEFNRAAPLRKLVHFDYEASIDAETGMMRVFVKPFVPNDVITAPNEATHFRLVAGGVCMSLSKYEFDRSFRESNLWAVDTTDAIGIELILNLPLKVEGPMMLFFGIQFCDDYNGHPNMRSYKKHNGLKLVEVA